MRTLTVDLGARSYPIIIGSGILSSIGERLKESTEHKRALVITDPRVGELYGELVVEAISGASFHAELFTIPEGEDYKTLQTANLVYDFLLKYNYSRQTTIVALGGGVVGDIAGFIASTYMRGVPFVQVPTTLLAMVDSSVGGKVAVNHPLGKNIIGAFYQPKLVFADIDCLQTLDMEELRAGYAEVIKYGVIWDREFFRFLDANTDKVFSLDQDVMTKIIERSCEIKARVVEEDELESGLRAILNYGHTIGHALESLTNYRSFKHGEAVTIGMTVAAKLANIIGILDQQCLNDQSELIAKASLPSLLPLNLDSEDIVERLKKDKKVRNGKVRFVLPETIGKVVIRDDITRDAIHQALEATR